MILSIILLIRYIFFSNKIGDMETNGEATVTSEPNTRVIVTFRDEKYDITDFVKKHPGGKQILLENNGKDVEQLMAENEHSERAYKLLEKYKISQ